MNRLKVRQIVVTEGKYDAARLESVIDALIITTDGFSVYTDMEKRRLIKRLGRENGVIILTDSDTAGFKIRNFLSDICAGMQVTNVYVPRIKGRERRKTSPSKEGLLGVEGIDNEVILKAFADAGIDGSGLPLQRGNLTYTDLYELGLSGGNDARKNRAKLAKRLGIPDKLSKKALLEVLNRMSDREGIEKLLKDKPVLFWDFHGTLTYPDNQWVDAATRLCDEHFPEMNISNEAITENLYGKCLPWWTYPERDTRHLVENDGWWKSCEDEFVKMYVASGLSPRQAAEIAPLIREYIIDPANHRLFRDAIGVLRELKNRGYRSYVLSNNFPELPEILKDLGLADYFEGCFVSALIGYDKPRKEIFLYAKERAGRQECVMIGDNPLDDIKGAKECGFTTVYVGKRDRDPRYCDYVCGSLSEITDIFI